MTNRTDLDPGQSIVYATKPTGLRTQLFMQCGDEGASQLTWHIELCCQSPRDIKLEAGEPKSVDISEAAGALVTVTNTGYYKIKVWTDY